MTGKHQETPNPIATQSPSTEPHRPLPQSLSYRANLARLITPLRRVRPRVPFYALAAHRIPTLWSLYRGLLRAAPTENIRFRVQMLFRRNQHSTSPNITREHLLRGHKWLDIFTKAKSGDTKLQTLLTRYDRLIILKREKEHWKSLLLAEFAWQSKLRARPILTGAYLRPSLANRPLPRLKPQPEALSMMICTRRRARDRRMEKLALLNEWRDDLRRERAFEAALAGAGAVERVYEDLGEWERPIQAVQRTLRGTFALDAARLHAPYPPALLRAIKAARREKIANKTRERAREGRGEVLPCTLARRRRGPPAHVVRMGVKSVRRVGRGEEEGNVDVELEREVRRESERRRRVRERKELEDCAAG